MSDVRRTHPGYYGVLLAIAAFYTYNGGGFLFYPDTFKSDSAYIVLQRVLPLFGWGVILALLGLYLLIAIFLLPHKWVRRGVLAGLMIDVFWTAALSYGQIIGEVHAFTLVSAWGAFAFIEYRALIEPMVNPATDKR